MGSIVIWYCSLCSAENPIEYATDKRKVRCIKCGRLNAVTGHHIDGAPIVLLIIFQKEDMNFSNELDIFCPVYFLAISVTNLSSPYLANPFTIRLTESILISGRFKRSKAVEGRSLPSLPKGMIR